MRFIRSMSLENWRSLRMTTSPRVVFFGNERLVSGLQHTETPILRGLIEHEYNIVAIVVNDRDAYVAKRPHTRGR